MVEMSIVLIYVSFRNFSRLFLSFIKDLNYSLKMLQCPVFSYIFLIDIKIHDRGSLTFYFIV